MFLKKSKYKNGRTFLSINDGYYDKVKKTSRTVTIQKLGYLDELEKEHDDPIGHFTELAKKKTLEKNSAKEPVTLKVDMTKSLAVGSNNSFNFGYLALSSIYHSLELDKLLKKLQRNTKSEYDSNAIMKLLVYTRMICPGSKLNAFENKEKFFDKFDFSLSDIYNCLTFFNAHAEEIQLWLNKMAKKKYNRNAKLVYYDVTNYYFEIDKADDLRKKGYSKENRKSPIVQMGLFMDTDGLPISYKIFPGNTLDKKTLIPAIENIQALYRLGRTIIVGDRGMLMADNIAEIRRARNGYVISRSIRGAEKEFKEYVLEQSEYRVDAKNGFKIKSKVYPREIQVTGDDGKKETKKIHEKVVVFYSQKYADKAKYDRAGTIEKARKMVENPSQYERATSHGASKYLIEKEVDEKTGEMLDNPTQVLQFDEEKLKNEEIFDGYYAIVTSELDETDDSIIKIYRGLWKIEESFKVTKSELDARPVHLSRADRINAHFLTCFISLLIGRIIENKLERKYSIRKILTSLSKAECVHFQENIYIQHHYDEVLEAIAKEFNIPFDKKYIKLTEIKKNLANTKKRDITQ